MHSEKGLYPYEFSGIDMIPYDTLPLSEGVAFELMCTLG